MFLESLTIRKEKKSFSEKIQLLLLLMKFTIINNNFSDITNNYKGFDLLMKQEKFKK